MDGCGAAELVPMRLWQIGVLAYGVLYFILACAMEVENVSQGYPLGYIAFSMVAQTLLVCGVFLFGLESSPDFTRLWRWLFPLLVLEVVVGIAFDATIPPEPHGAEWFWSEALGLWLAAPAYYFNLRIARYRG
jgi:hypothetical protein